MNDPNALPDSVLRLAAERAAGDPYYFAHTLDAYQRAHGLSDAQVAADLQCAERDIYAISLCRQPDLSDMSRFTRDIETIASRFGISAPKLSSLVRLAHRSAAAPASAASATEFVTRATPYAMAARDREPDDETPEEETGGAGGAQGGDA